MATQSYENHRAIDPQYVGIALVALIALLLTGVIASGLGNTYIAAAQQLLVIVAIVMLILRMRAYGLKLQDRIIRLEMQVRLARLAMEDKAAQLSIKQLIGLRFASDGELPGLIDQVLSENLQKPDDIKKRIKEWQPDFQRI